jgi:hypothetical protein
MMSQLEANFQQLGSAIPTGEWPDYIVHSEHASTVHQCSCGIENTHRHPTNTKREDKKKKGLGERSLVLIS